MHTKIVQPKSWQEAEERQTYLWLACVEAAKKTLETAVHMGAKSTYAYSEEIRGFAATIYKEVRDPSRFADPEYRIGLPV